MHYLKADGIHIARAQPVKTLRATLKSESIGVFAATSRHIAMEAAEAGADYVAFAQGSQAHGEPLIGWWQDIFEVPAVAFDPSMRRTCRTSAAEAGLYPAHGRDVAEPRRCSPCGRRPGEGHGMTRLHWTAIVRGLTAGLFLMLAIPHAQAATLAEVQALYQAKKFKDAFTAVKPLAEGGDAAAMTLLATLYRNGEGTDESSDNARTWFKKAAEAAMPKHNTITRCCTSMKMRARPIPPPRRNGWPRPRATATARRSTISA